MNGIGFGIGAKSLAVAGALAAAFGAVSIARAQVATVESGPNLIQSIMNQINTMTQQVQDYGEYAKEAKRWYDQYQHMQQQLIKLQGLSSKIAPMSNQFARRAEDYGMVDRCPGSKGGLSLALLRQWAGIDVQGEVGPQQLRICEYIVLAENAQYNETVDMLQRLRARSNEFGRVEDRRSSVGDSEGKLQANNNDVMRLAAGMQVELDYWEAMLTGYDSYIELLRSDQQRLAIAALNGPKGPWGTVIQGAVLKGALEAAESRDR
jgi:hypothetical protein